MTSDPRWVRDRQWAIASPPLIESAAGPAPPTALLENDEADSSGPAPVTRSARLGVYFEDLWADWINRHPGYVLVDRNLPVREPGRTIGEYDFILQNRRTGRYLHLEVAVKFYLGVGDLSRLENWFGPNPEDCLALKIGRLLNHQIRLSAHPRSRAELGERGIEIRDRAIVLKGRLYYPLAGARDLPSGVNAHHLYGFWGTVSQWLEAWSNAELEWAYLPKRLWLSEASRDDLGVTRPLSRLLTSPPFEPLLRTTALVALRDGRECLRGFVVNESWLDRVGELRVDRRIR